MKPGARGSLFLLLALGLSAAAFATYPRGGSPATQLVSIALALAALAGGWLRPDGTTLALAAAAPLLPALPRFLSDPRPAPSLLCVALAGTGAAFARRRASGEPLLLPRSVKRWGGFFLVVALASAVSSWLRGETLYLLLRGGASPLFVNRLWMSADDRTREAFRALLVFALIALALEAFAWLAASPEGERRLIGALAAGAIAAFAIALLEPRLPFPLTGPSWTYLQRRAGSFTDPNAHGLYAALLAPLLAAAAARRSRHALLAGAALVLALLAIEVSGSRSGLLLLAVAALAAGVGIFRTFPRTRLPLAAAAAAALLAAVLAYRFLPRGGSVSQGGLVKRLGAVLSAKSLEDAATHRPLFWRAAFEVIAEEPLSGCGLGAFPFEFPLRYAKRHGPIDVTDNATNTLLDLAAESGLPALILALLAGVPILVVAFEAAFTADRAAPPPSRAAGAALVGFAAASLAGSHFRIPELAVLCAACVALLPAAREEATDEDSAFRAVRVPWVLAASGVLASFLVVLPTRSPDAAFRNGPWDGVYGWEVSPGSAKRWMGPRAFRRIRPGETSLTLNLTNQRPDGRAVLVRADLDGSPVTPLVVPPGQTRLLVVERIPPGTAALRLRAAPSFVPYRLTRMKDFRELSLLLGWDEGETAR